jgi:hypothetical protein
MKDLLAKLDELHAKATPGEWDYEPRGVSCDPADDVHTLRAGDRNLSTGSKWEGTVLLCDAEAIVELHNHWKEVRAYIASLEAALPRLVEIETFIYEDGTQRRYVDGVLQPLSEHTKRERARKGNTP